MVFLLIDGSIPPQKIDLAYANWLTDNEVPFAIAFTKVDKRRKGAVKSTVHVDAFKRALLQDLAYLPPSIVTSAAAGIGKGEMLRLIASLRVAFVASGRLQAIRQGAIPAGHLRGPLSRQDQQDQQQQQEGEQQQEQQQSDASSAAGIPGAGKEQPAVQGTQTSRGSQGQGTSRGGKAGAGSAPAAAASGAKQPAGRKGAQPTRGSQAQTKGPAGKPQSPGQRQAPGSAQKGAKPKAKVQ